MKFSSQEEYGVRCLLRIAKQNDAEGLTIPEISRQEGLSQPNAAKILRVLRIAGFIEGTRGQSGGYKLNKPPEAIIIGEVLNVLGGKLFESSFCGDHKGISDICTHSIDCSLRSLWRAVQGAIDGVLQKTTLKDLMSNEHEVNLFVEQMIEAELK